MKYEEARIALLDNVGELMLVAAEDRENAFGLAIEYDLGQAFGAFPPADRWMLVDLEDEGDGLVVLVVAVNGNEQAAKVAETVTVTETLTPAELMAHAESHLYDDAEVG